MVDPEEPEIVLPLEDTLDHFWESETSLDGFTLAIRPAGIEMPLLKRLGEPAFVPAPGLEASLKEAYRSISKAAMDAAYQETPAEAAAPPSSSEE